MVMIWGTLAGNKTRYFQAPQCLLQSAPKPHLNEHLKASSEMSLACDLGVLKPGSSSSSTKFSKTPAEEVQHIQYTNTQL